MDITLCPPYTPAPNLRTLEQNLKLSRLGNRLLLTSSFATCHVTHTSDTHAHTLDECVWWGKIVRHQRMNGQGYSRSRIEFNLFFMFQHLGSPLAFSSFIIHVSFLILKKNIEFMIIFLFAEHVGSGPPAPFSAVGPLAPCCPCAQWHVCSTGGHHFVFVLFCDCICAYIFTKMNTFSFWEDKLEGRGHGVLMQSWLIQYISEDVNVSTGPYSFDY